jgi:hypothetical protein
MAGLVPTYSWEDTDTGAPSIRVGTIATVTTDPHTGAKHAEVDAADSIALRHYDAWVLSGVNNRDYFLRFYFKKSANPSAVVKICLLGSLAAARYGELHLRTDGRLKLSINGNVDVLPLSAPLANGYHCLELRVRNGTTSSNGQVEGRIDGVQFAVATNVNLGTSAAPDELRIGVPNIANGTGGTTLRWDDVALNDNQGASDNTWPGPIGSVVEGAASLSGSGSLTAAGRRVRRASAALHGSGALSATGSKTTTAAAALDAHADIAASGQRARAASAVLAAAASLSVSGRRVRTSAASLAGAATLSATGRRVVAGSASCAASAALTAGARRNRTAGAGLHGAANVTATGRATRCGHAALAGTATLQGHAFRVRRGAAVLACESTLVAAGVIRFPGATVATGTSRIGGITTGHRATTRIEEG